MRKEKRNIVTYKVEKVRPILPISRFFSSGTT